MKKILILIAIFICLISGFASADELGIKSQSAVLIEGETGQVLYEKNKDKKLNSSTLSDILFVSAVLDNVSGAKSITASENAISSCPSDESNIAARVGEEFKAEDLLCAVMLGSAVDAKNMLIESVWENNDAFISELESKVIASGASKSDYSAYAEIGSEVTTTSYDMALILKKSVENKNFLDIFSRKNHTVSATNKFKNERNLRAPNMFFSEEDSEKLGIKGIKTGYSVDAGNVAAVYADNGERSVIAVVMGANTLNDIISDISSLLGYGFGSFNKLTLGVNEIPAFTEDLITYSLAEDVTFLIKNDIPKESLEYSYSDKGIEISDPDGNILTKAKVRVEEETPVYLIITRVILFTLLALILLIAIFIISGIARHNKKKKARKEKIKRIMQESDKPEKINI